MRTNKVQHGRSQDKSAAPTFLSNEKRKRQSHRHAVFRERTTTPFMSGETDEFWTTCYLRGMSRFKSDLAHRL